MIEARDTLGRRQYDRNHHSMGGDNGADPDALINRGIEFPAGFFDLGYRSFSNSIKDHILKSLDSISTKDEEGVRLLKGLVEKYYTNDSSAIPRISPKELDQAKVLLTKKVFLDLYRSGDYGALRLFEFINDAREALHASPVSIERKL